MGPRSPNSIPIPVASLMPTAVEIVLPMYRALPAQPDHQVEKQRAHMSLIKLLFLLSSGRVLPGCGCVLVNMRRIFLVLDIFFDFSLTRVFVYVSVNKSITAVNLRDRWLSVDDSLTLDKSLPLTLSASLPRQSATAETCLRHTPTSVTSSSSSSVAI